MAGLLKRTVLYVILGGWLAGVLFPLIWLVLGALRSSQEIFQNPFGIPWLFQGSPYAGDPRVPSPFEAMKDNFHTAWVSSHFSDFFLNSVIVTGLSLTGLLLISAMAAYVITRFRFAGRNALLLYFVSGLMIPAQLVLVPLFFEFIAISDAGSYLLAPLGIRMDLNDTIAGLVLIYITLGLPFTIFVLSGFFRTIPKELREAGIMDGCSEHRVFWSIMFPLARPGLVTVAIFNFLGIWNEYLFALVFINSESHKTLPLGLATVSLMAQRRTDFGLMFAAMVIVVAPTLFVYCLLQTQLTRGITMGALKG